MLDTVGERGIQTIAVCILLILALAMVSTAWSADPFPPSALPGISIGGKLPAGYESSGITWHPRLKKFFLVSDRGTVSSLRVDGTDTWGDPTNPKRQRGTSSEYRLADASGWYRIAAVFKPKAIRQLGIEYSAFESA